MIAHLAPGDCFLACAIGADSFPIENLLTVRVPRRLRPIDPAFERRLLALKAEWQRALSEQLRGRPAMTTDVWGGLQAAGQTLGATAARERWLLVYSDLDHNANGHSGGAAALHLPDVRVQVFFVPRTLDPPRFRERLRTWHAAFRQAGAREVQLHDTDLVPLEISR